MTIEKKRAVLEAAGIKVRANAAEETVERLYQEHLNGVSDAAEEPADAAKFGPDGEVIKHGVIYEDGKGIGLTGLVGNVGCVGVATISEAPPLNPFTVAAEIPARSPLNQPVAVKKGPDAIPVTPTMAEFWRFKNAHCDGSLGIKTPVVIEWARHNLPPAEYKALYDGKTLPI